MKKDCETCLKQDRNHHAEDCLYCMQYHEQPTESKEEDYIDKSTKEVFDSWCQYVKEKTPSDYEWHDTSDTYRLFGFDKVRYNKEHPHTIDLMTADGTTYYGVYPTNITTETEVNE